jgi:PKD repeat protein
MWPRTPLRGTSLSPFHGTHRDRNPHGRTRRRPHLEILEQRQLLNGTPGPITVNIGGPYVGKAQSSVQFSACASDPAHPNAKFTYNWNFGDGTTGTGASPVHTYALDGIYSVSVKAQEPNGASGTATTAPSIWPVANAGANLAGNEGATISFQGSTIGGNLSDHWDFGDGSTADGTLTPSHVYADNGTYTVTLTATDAYGMSSQSSLVATIANVPPTAQVAGASSGYVGSPLGFSASATDPSPIDQAAGFTFNWNFGDGTTGTGATATHTYTTAGTYTVSVTATDKDGGTSAPATQSVNVVSVLTVSAGSNFSGNEGASVTFQGSVTGGTAPYTYSWNFGDGTTASGSLTPSHTYADNGTYTAVLWVIDSAGYSGSGSVVATINSVPPTASISSPSQGTAGAPVSFTASATDASPADQAAGFTYTWNFGDGTTCSGSNPSHTYALDGIYTVTVTATDTDGGQGQATTVVDIYPSVSAGLDPTVSEGQTVNFVGTTAGSSSLSYHWNFGDGGTADGTLTPSHVYTEHGTYTATLTATDTVYGFSSSSSIPMTVLDVAPTVTLNAPSQGTAGAPVSFTATASSPSPIDQAAGVTYAWSFGDGGTGSGANASHAYSSAGTYTVSVTATDIDGATSYPATATLTIASSGSLAVSAGGNITTDAGATVTFAGAVSGGTGPYTCSWNFGDCTPTGNTATFVQTDTTTQGNWMGAYGTAGYNVIGSNSSYPSYATVTPSGQSLWTWAATTSDVRGLQIPGSTSRIAACWYSSASFMVDVNLTDGLVHPVSLYAMDWDSTSRSERIDLLDGSGAVLDTRTIASFSGGEYVTWNISGHVQFKVTMLAGANAVISGLFLGAAVSGCNTPTPSHNYSNPGTYTATLTATDSAGHSGSSSAVVTVNNVAPTVTLNAPSSGTVGAAMSFTAIAADVSPADQAAGFTYNWTFGDGTTGTGASPTHTYTVAGTYTVSVTATDQYGATSQAATASLQITQVVSHVYYVSPNPTSGSGTLSNPFGMPDLTNTTNPSVYTPGAAFAALQPGDTLCFRAGTYNVPNGPGGYTTQMWGPLVSGTASAPITIAAYPGETVNIVYGNTGQPFFGTSYPQRSYVRFIGFTIYPHDPSIPCGPGFVISGTSNEVAYCEIIGNANIGTITTNHPGISVEYSTSGWFHHNNIHGYNGTYGQGIELYDSTLNIIEDNYLHDNDTGIVDKDSGPTLATGGNKNTYRRNWLTNNVSLQFAGNMNGASDHWALYYIYDNVWEGPGGIFLGGYDVSSQVYNNLDIITNNAGAMRFDDHSYLLNAWNNITLFGSGTHYGFWDGYATDPFPGSGSTTLLSYYDYNVYDGTPQYLFPNGTFTLAQMQSNGYENHAYVDSDTNIFLDQTNYVLMPAYQTAGRYGDPVGPRYPVAQIRNTSRYGPGALNTGSSPSITQQPQNQTVTAGGAATFSVQVSGSGLLYQWLRSNDGGNTWLTIQGANATTFTIPTVSTTDNGAIVRCLVSSVGGSAWSSSAMLAVTSAAAAAVPSTMMQPSNQTMTVVAASPAPQPTVQPVSELVGPESGSAAGISPSSQVAMALGSPSSSTAPRRARRVVKVASHRSRGTGVHPIVHRSKLTDAGSPPSTQAELYSKHALFAPSRFGRR